jgi:hypothetical protein
MAPLDHCAHGGSGFRTLVRAILTVSTTMPDLCPVAPVWRTPLELT